MTPAEAAMLAESEARFRTMADHAPVLLWLAGRDARCEFFNQGWLRFTGRTMAEELGSGWAAGVHPEDFQRCMHVYLDAFVARRAFTMEYRLRRHDGVYRWILDQGAPRVEPDGTFAGFIGSCVDITEQRESQERLRLLADDLAARVREREVLLREVHHRVKNDLQVIVSLLGIQARRLDDPGAVAALVECQSRVDTIALVHEQIYQNRDIARIPFAPYARQLAAGVFRTLGGAPGAVTLAVEIADVVLPVEQAIPCGMIVHELVSNSLKHAFPDGRTGTIRVGFAPGAERGLELTVRDDGVGMPAGLDVAKLPSMGWRLVAAFADQLGAHLAVERDGGTTVRVVLP